jgi:phage terminase large subunit
MKGVIYKPFLQQELIHNFSTQFCAAVAGVQSGKTYSGSVWAAKKMAENRDRPGIIVAPSYKTLHQATLDTFFRIFPIARNWYKEQRGEMHIPGGGVVFIRSAENPLMIEGISPAWWWLDEGGMTSRLTWTVLRSRVSLTGGQGLITTTPYNLGWLYQEFFLPWKEKRDDQLTFITWKSVDNPYFSPKFYEAEQKRLPPEEFARRYMGEFRKMVGLVWDLPEEHIIEPIPNLAQKAEARIIGVDWGFRSPAAVVVLYYFDRVWYVVDEWKRAEKTTSEIIQVIKNKVAEHRAERVFADSAEPDRIEESKRASIPMYEANKDVLGGLSFVKQLIFEGRLRVYKTCEQTLDEMSMYHYEEPGINEKEPREEPVKFNDHIVDGLRYAIYSHQGVKQVFGQASPILKPYYGRQGMPF